MAFFVFQLGEDMPESLLGDADGSDARRSDTAEPGDEAVWADEVEPASGEDEEAGYGHGV